MNKKPERDEFLICTNDTVIEKGIPTLDKAIKEAEVFTKAFVGLPVYICKVIADAARV